VGFFKYPDTKWIFFTKFRRKTE